MRIEKLGNYISEVSVRNKNNSVTDVFSVTNSQGFIRSTEYFSKEVFSKDIINYKVVGENEFAYNPSRINVGSIDYLKQKDKVVISPLYVAFKCNKELNEEFLKVFLKSPIGNTRIRAKTKGAVRDTLSFGSLCEIKVPILSIDNQLHIANLLSKAENLIGQRKESIRLLDEFLKSTFLEMFGDPVRNEKGWKVEQLGKVTFMKAGQFVAASDIQSEFSEGLYSCYGGNGLRGYVKTYTHEGDFVLIGRQGALCGNVKIAKGQFHATEHAVVCSPKMQFETFWLYYLLDIVNLNKYASGAAQPGLAVGRLEQIEIIYPPIELQIQFAQIVEKTEALKSQYQQSLQELEHLYGSLSQKAFRGELIKN